MYDMSRAVVYHAGGEGHLRLLSGPSERWFQGGATPGKPLHDLIVRNCRVAGSSGVLDIAIRGGHIVAIAEALPFDAEVELAVDGRLVTPAFVQPHIHLDKVGVAPLLGPNVSGTLAEAIDLLHSTKRASSVDDVARRAGQVIQQAVLAGTTVIRSHVDVDTIGGLTPLLGVLKAARAHE